MWFKTAFGAIGKAVRQAIDKSVESFKKVQKEVKQKVTTVVNRIVTSKDAPKGTKSKVDVRENQVTVEIETPNDAIKSDIHESAKQAEQKVEWRMSEHAKELAEQNTLKTLHDAYVHGEFADPKKYLKEYDITDPKNLFSPEKFENARGYIWKAVAEKMEQSSIWDNVYQRAKQLILEKRHLNFFRLFRTSDDKHNLTLYCFFGIFFRRIAKKGADYLLMNFGYFTNNGNLSVAECVCKVAESLGKLMGSFIENHCPFFVYKGAYMLFSFAFFNREKAFKSEAS